MNDCVLFLSTYDGGEDLWEGFFKALKIQWPEFDMPVVMNTETKDFSYEGFDIKCVHPKKPNAPWGKRLKETLKSVNSEYILLFLEDYWLDDRVDNDYFLQNLQALREHPNISTFSYYPCMPGQNIDDGLFDRMEKRPLKCEYKLNCQVSIWRRKDLISYIRNHESPWEWEINGSLRASRYRKDFYTLKEGAKKCFSYGDPVLGCMVKKGKWVKEVAIPMAKKYGLEIDFTKRGFITVDEIMEEPEKLSFTQRLKKPHLIKRLCAKFVRFIRKLMSII